MAEQKPSESPTSREFFVGWLRFLLFLIGVMIVSQAAMQVYEHWEPVDENRLLYAIFSFAHYLWPRLLIGGAFGAIFLVIAVLFKQRPPWLDDD